MAVSKMLGHASYVTTLTVCADYITTATAERPRRCADRSRQGDICASAAAIIDPALAAEQRMAAAAAGHSEGLGERYRQVAERNRRQIRRPS